MTIDDSFLKKEAAKRRFFSYMLVLLCGIFVTLTVIYFTGYFSEEPTISRIIIYSELSVFVILYLVFKRTVDRKK